MTVLACGIFVFGRIYYRSAWGPLAMMAAMLLAWSVPFGHTGLHSLPAVIEGAPYPATLLVGLALVLWALVIKATTRPSMSLWLMPLVAFMFATHQLGAGIALIGAATLVLFWPNVSLATRAAITLAVTAGLGLSALWPYFNPFDAVISAGNPRWTGPPDFYSLGIIGIALIPSALGLWGLITPVAPETRTPFLVMLAAFTAFYLVGLAGIMVAARFLMPIVLLLHIGLGSLVLLFFRSHRLHKGWQRLTAVAVGWSFVVFHATLLIVTYIAEAANERRAGNVYDQAKRLTSDIPDGTPIAAYDVAVWPVVATGQKAVSVPWPEPMIRNLTARQATVERLFDSRLSRSARIALARRLGVNTLIIDDRNAFRRRPDDQRLWTLRAQSRSWRKVGHMWRFDLG